MPLEMYIIRIQEKNLNLNRDSNLGMACISTGLFERELAVEPG